MATMMKKYVCSTEELANEAKGELLEDGFAIIFGPEHMNYGATDMTKNGDGNIPYDDAWVVIGVK